MEHRLIAAARLDQRLCEIKSSVGQPRIDGQGPSIGFDRLIRPIEFGQQIGEIIPGTGMQRVEFARQAVLIEGAGRVVRGVKGVAQVESERGVWSPLAD